MKLVSVFVAVAVTGLALAAGSGSGATSAPRLIGAVGQHDAFKITLKNARGRLVRTLEPGTYTIVVRDASAIHNFELEREHGKSWDITDVDFVGTKTIRVKLTRGSYKAYCEPHEGTMVQRFIVR